MRNQPSIGLSFRHCFKRTRRPNPRWPSSLISPNAYAVSFFPTRNATTPMATPRSSILALDKGYSYGLKSLTTQTKVNVKSRESQEKRKTSKVEDDGLTLSHFIAKSMESQSQSPVHLTQTKNVDSSSDFNSMIHVENSHTILHAPEAADLGNEFDDADLMVTDAMSSSNKEEASDSLDRLRHQMIDGPDCNDHNESFHTLKFHIKTYGCQMNVNDTDIMRSILLNNHTRQPTGTNDHSSKLKFTETDEELHADVLLTNTCAIRENAEQKVWHRLRELRSYDRFPLSSLDNGLRNELSQMTKKQRKQLQKQSKKGSKKRIIGVLGCMAERLKEDMFKDGTADVVVGPDAYRDLPRLISVLSAPSSVSNDDSSDRKESVHTIPTERAVNVQLSLDETYASITPIRSNPNDVSAFVSVMRGCNNMCSFCVVPFTRGRERSREMESIVAETKRLLEEEDIKEVILLGQNVNSYNDTRGNKSRGRKTNDANDSYRTSNNGFSNMFRLRHGDGYRFADLLEAVSSLSPELRVRFTSPHPKDYPPPLLSLMAERSNICNHLHMPAQSGSSSVLQRMRRGYTREAYLELITDVRNLIPGVAISSDFIAGFCGETEEEHRETVSLMEEVKFDQAFMFAYSMREKTHAHRVMTDDVPADVKNRRLNEVIDCFRHNVQLKNDKEEVGKLRLVLIEGEAKRSTVENPTWSGRTDENKRVVFAANETCREEELRKYETRDWPSLFGAGNKENILNTQVDLSRGDYAVVQIEEARGHTLKGRALWRSSIAGFERLVNMDGWSGMEYNLTEKSVSAISQ
ncbi:hypothetical protein ACHAWF_009877 [Thalassiosira exigua]